LLRRIGGGVHGHRVRRCGTETRHHCNTGEWRWGLRPRTPDPEGPFQIYQLRFETPPGPLLFSTDGWALSYPPSLPASHG
jgi:hypothetical protein